MIDLRGKRPAEPIDFAARTKAARDHIASIQDKSKLTEKDFADVWGEYRNLFEKAQSGGKCAYCETRIRSAAYGAVEHFRPKTEVREPKDAGQRDDTAGLSPKRKFEAAVKPGYYWLAYDWKNYLFSCDKCNSTWKKNSFPVEGKRQGPPTEGVEKSESALLLNPFDESPEDHFEYDENGDIRGRTEKGRITIDRLGLDRKSLEFERQIVAQKVQKYLQDLEINALSLEKAVDYLTDLCRSREPFAGLARFLVAQALALRIADLRID